ncbi:hypothetical protein DVS28_a4931 [Euzebya pacifica]|uniref:Uncharacterized protein n=1 Tax=Euzebya pacifica TaxID=1608957 RepID=A0A346Y541_9ACTN|nr:hypothetical protein DVS28_a4931 [Euzebya pacifica]
MVHWVLRGGDVPGPTPAIAPGFPRKGSVTDHGRRLGR